MIRHSIALQIAWRLAESEALHSRQAEIAPAHFFLGLLKTAELDLFEILKDKTALSEQDIQIEVAMNETLRDALQQQGLDSTRVRRKLRHSLPRGHETQQEDQQLRRSCEARELFRAAEQLAEAEKAVLVGPLHLYASFKHIRCAILMQAIETAGLDFNALVADITQPQPTPKNKTATRKKTRVGPEGQKNPAPLLGQQGIVEKWLFARLSG